MVRTTSPQSVHYQWNQQDQCQDDWITTIVNMSNVMWFTLYFQTSAIILKAVTSPGIPYSLLMRAMTMTTFKSSSLHSVGCNPVTRNVKKHLHPKIYPFLYFGVAGKHTLRMDLTVLVLSPVRKRRSLVSVKLFPTVPWSTIRGTILVFPKSSSTLLEIIIIWVLAE